MARRRPEGDPSRVEDARIKTKVWLEVDERFVVGDGGLRLLQGIIAHGSLLSAASEIGWSYRHAWGYLKRAEAALGTALTETRPGKGVSRGMALTHAGRQIVERLTEIRSRIDAVVGPSGPTRDEIAKRGRRGVPPPAAPARAARRATRYRDGDWRAAR